MKKLMFVTFMMALVTMGLAQSPVTVHANPKPKPCGPVTVDILYGSVNQLLPGSTNGQIKQRLPCYGSEIDEKVVDSCGGGVFYPGLDLKFYTQRDYIEVGEKFKGKITLPLMGAKRNALFGILGNAKISEPGYDIYDSQYGSIILHFNKEGKVSRIQISSRSPQELDLFD